MFRTITLEDDTTIEVVDNMCNHCIKDYVDNVDDLDSHSYAFEHETEQIYSNFTSYKE